MSYQVLARKWRPRSFDDMVGQQHVVRALSNALDRDQLHHAYLFTGTRGVGKTTLARILSKALNCEQGVSSKPCGVCSACREIDSGRFVDLLEVDAASRTKVDQTRELLENVPYAPARARFKVYLIDEVHMFSGHSFNALLKTLEEPPPHVKFLLATTDPQKIPVTVLSRCLQLNLRRLLPGEIVDRLRYVLEQEGLAFESSALPLLARAADGSLRDALSLLDQAIAFGGGRVVEAETRAMLGTVSGDLALDILDALTEGDGAAVLAAVERVAAMTPDFAELLRELILLLHRLALIQQVPATLAPDDPDRTRMLALAERLAPEDVQLCYQVALTGQTDLPLAPDPRTGLEMVLLRALAFRPVPGAQRPAGSPRLATDTDHAPPRSAPSEAAPTTAATPSARPAPPQPPSAPEPTPIQSGTQRLDSAADWQQLAERLSIGGIANQLAHNCAFRGYSNGRLSLQLDPAAERLRVPSTVARFKSALEQALGGPIDLDIQVARPEQETLAQRHAREAGERQQTAVEQMQTDSVAQSLRANFEAEWAPGSIRPAD
ncbi:DNA polymerase III subunit gamma/tau [Allochromatium palmeri]|uniref:DNA polymerase III subunit gamma/tau n=1 Tax=Allochromatium palmeri TaxID=231048 RepID=A0A6N8E6L9_9GAMM|nr:DNA polymerase III subunit gamma/tau [Allochromatium palmeri]MTW19862.1 DNA polymerase III subunit gamma/tau [Allochromatium palmeri]